MFSTFKLFFSRAVAATDAFFEYVALLLNTSATNGAQNNTFLDGSTNNFSITRNGNATQGTFSPFSQTGWSNFVPNTAYITIPGGAGFQFGTGDFTIEMFVWIDNSISNPAIIASTGGGFSLFFSSGLLFYQSVNASTNVITNAGGPNRNTWAHIAITRSGTTTRLFVNGVQNGSGTDNNNYIDTSSYRLGSRTSNSTFYSGYFSNVRIVKGTALYTSAFTPPTSPLTNISGTSVLTCQSNRFIDTSSNALTITPTSASIQAFSPFNPTAAWSAGTNGGSGYFDGNGDNLSIASNVALNLSSGDFTVEAFVYWSGSNANSTIFNKDGLIASSYPSYDMSLNGSGFVICYVGSGNGTSSLQSITSSTALLANTWTHLAFVKNGTTLTLYQNGASVASATQTATITDGGKALLIGYNAGQATGYYFNGYISNARIVKGTAVYTANFTPPTAPLTAITNTSLLLNFTNAGIYDSASGNDLETVGNAQVSTVQAKWGTTSMAFDGTDDRLVFPSSQQLAMGTGDFTIEGWVRRSDTNVRGIFQLCGTAGGLSGAANLGLAIGSDTGQVWRIYANNAGYNSTATWAINTWYHFALVKTAGNIKLYVDGTSVITQADTTNYTGTFLCVGGFYDTTFLMNGYIDDLRITKGYARYTANFTPPTAAFPLN